MSSLVGLVLGAGLFLAIGAGLYRLGGRWAPKGTPSPGKRQPYACGEDLFPEGTQLSYQRFFRVVLMFVVVHLGALVVASLPMTSSTRWLATVYLLGVAVCVDMLLSGVDHGGA